MKVRYIIVFMIIYVISFFLFLGLPYAGTSPENETVGLQKKIAALEERIIYLEALLKECSRQIPEEPGLAGWQNRKNWRRLDTGMDMEKVRSILGTPIRTIEGVRTLWYYPSIYCGYVSFDKDGNLIGWNEP